MTGSRGAAENGLDVLSVDSAEAVFGPGGPLARKIDGYAVRRQQQAMAAAVEKAINDRSVLIAEAGTGTGKTFAYLVPALLSGGRTIVSTGTRNLQDQLYHNDLPLVRDALGTAVSIALLKGRSNYVCLYRLDQSMLGLTQRSRELVEGLVKVRRWASQTRSGDIAELSELPENSVVWPIVTSTSDNCLGQDCPVYTDCHLLRARGLAQEADLVVINHHLLCADFALKEEGFGDLLPGADCFVVDEAHQLPAIAANFFGVSLTAGQLLDLARDSDVECLREAGDMPRLREPVAAIAAGVADVRGTFSPTPRKGGWGDILSRTSTVEALEKLSLGLHELAQALELVAGRGAGLQSCWRRTRELKQRVDLFLRPDDDGSSVRWYETFKQGFRLNLTPLEIGQVFRQQVERYPAAWILTSATLAVGDNFSHFARQLGLDEAATERWGSPYDYGRNALLYVPQNMPAPADSEYDRAVAETAERVIVSSRGRTFLLFTSHRALRRTAELLGPRLPYPLLIQGDAPKADLLARFRQLGNAVLLGTASFWEGVDVRGPALSCVLIDKLPFASPDDPVLNARLRMLRDSGAEPFMDFQLPQAVIALKQGMGRLIRSEEDRGVLVVCDPRLFSRGYGRLFLRSLPPLAITREVSDVDRFFVSGSDGEGSQ